MNQPSKILILDDDVDLTGLIKIRLEGEGYEVSVLHAPKDCLKEIYIFRPDLILLDVDLPGKNGLVVFLEIKEILSSKANDAGKILFPVMILSGVKSVAVQALFKAKGVFDYLCKPVDSQILLEKIVEALNYFSACEGFGIRYAR